MALFLVYMHWRCTRFTRQTQLLLRCRLSFEMYDASKVKNNGLPQRFPGADNSV
jgi:hypothetical protein